MTFKYCSIGKEDTSRILSDISGDGDKYRLLQYFLEREEFPKSWSLDNEHNEYLFHVPAIVRQPWESFYFYSRGYMYEIMQVTNFDKKISFHRFPESSISIRNEIELSVIDALIVCQDYYTWIEFNDNWDNLTDEQRKMRVPIFIADNCNYDI